MAFEPEKGSITHFKHIHRGAISAIQYWCLSNLKFSVHISLVTFRILINFNLFLYFRPRGKLVLISSIDGVITAWSAELILKEEYQV